jgi:hypothetical protein
MPMNTKKQAPSTFFTPKNSMIKVRGASDFVARRRVAYHICTSMSQYCTSYSLVPQITKHGLKNVAFIRPPGTGDGDCTANGSFYACFMLINVSFILMEVCFVPLSMVAHFFCDCFMVYSRFVLCFMPMNTKKQAPSTFFTPKNSIIKVRGASDFVARRRVAYYICTSMSQYCISYFLVPQMSKHGLTNVAHPLASNQFCA